MADKTIRRIEPFIDANPREKVPYYVWNNRWALLVEQGNWSQEQIQIAFEEIIPLGETSSTAYRGDRGKIAYDHSQVIGNPHGMTKADVGLSDVTNDAQVKRSEVVQETGTSTTNVMSQDAVAKAIGSAGYGDMMKGTYDANNNGIVDDAEKLGGQLPGYYAENAHKHVKADVTDFPTYGTTAGTICQGNDTRLSDTRTPKAHAATHKTGGSDALSAEDVGAVPRPDALKYIRNPGTGGGDYNAPDFNTLPTNGFYRISNAAGATNQPPGVVDGFLFVMSYSGTTRVAQLYIDDNGVVAQRSWNGSRWTTWETLVGSIGGVIDAQGVTISKTDGSLFLTGGGARARLHVGGGDALYVHKYPLTGGSPNGTYFTVNSDGEMSATAYKFGGAVSIVGKQDGADVLVLQGGTANAISMRGVAIRCRNSNDTAFCNVYGNSFTNPSASKYKHDIKDVTDKEATDLLKLAIKNYVYNEDEEERTQIGVIAEEAHEHGITYPIVYANGEPDGIDYSKFTPAIIKLCQTQEKRIVELETKIADLEARLEKLEKQ